MSEATLYQDPQVMSLIPQVSACTTAAAPPPNAKTSFDLIEAWCIPKEFDVLKSVARIF
jgi:hypothetical protein